MTRFEEIQGLTVILHTGGTFRKAAVFHYEHHFYAKYGSGFVRLNADGSTSKGKVRFGGWPGMKSLNCDKLGRLCSIKAPDSKPLTAGQKQDLKIAA